MKRKYINTKLAFRVKGVTVNNNVNPLKNMSHEVKDHTGLPGLEKQNSLLSKRRGRALLSGCAFAAPGTAEHGRLHRGPWPLRKRKANVIRDAFFPRAGTTWGWLKKK